MKRHPETRVLQGKLTKHLGMEPGDDEWRVGDTSKLEEIFQEYRDAVVRIIIEKVREN